MEYVLFGISLVFILASLLSLFDSWLSTEGAEDTANYLRIAQVLATLAIGALIMVPLWHFIKSLS